MDKQNIQSYVDIAQSYFNNSDEVKFLGQVNSKALFLKALNDYYNGKIDLIVVALIASDLYWTKNDTIDIEEYWDPYFVLALQSCEDTDYYFSDDETSGSYIETMEKNLKHFWDHETIN